MDEQDYKNLLTVYQTRYIDQINQNIVLEARELRYKQTIDALNSKISDLESKLEKTKRTATKTKDIKDAGNFT